MATYQFLFHNVMAAIHLKKVLQQQNIDFIMMDAPRELTQSFGLSIRFNWEKELDPFIFQQETHSIYRSQKSVYHAYWQNE